MTSSRGGADEQADHHQVLGVRPVIIKRLVNMTDDQVTKEARRHMDLLERMTHDRSHLRYDIQGAA